MKYLKFLFLVKLVMTFVFLTYTIIHVWHVLYKLSTHLYVPYTYIHMLLMFNMNQETISVKRVSDPLDYFTTSAMLYI